MKNILVTGASGGMGKAICKLLLEKKYHVYGLDCKRSGLTEFVHFIPCDITDTKSIDTAFEHVKRLAGHIDAIVHTAGIYDLDSLLEMSEERFLRIFEVNLFGVYRINKRFVPILNKAGRIIITSSELAPLDPLPFTGIYAVTKAALEKYAYSLRMEVNLLDISVSVIRPGAVNTGMLHDSIRALDRFTANTRFYRCNAQRFKTIVDRIETKNIAPEKIAQVVYSALESRHPRFVYRINCNLLLRFMNLLPDTLQTAIIKAILQP